VLVISHRAKDLQSPLPLQLDELSLGPEPVLLVLAGFSTSSFVQLVGTFSYRVVCGDIPWHHRHFARVSCPDNSFGLRLLVSLGITQEASPVRRTKRKELQMG
jgi:hypothetical protein